MQAYAAECNESSSQIKQYQLKMHTCIAAQLCIHQELILDILHTNLHKTRQQWASHWKEPVLKAPMMLRKDTYFILSGYNKLDIFKEINRECKKCNSWKLTAKTKQHIADKFKHLLTEGRFKIMCSQAQTWLKMANALVLAKAHNEKFLASSYIVIPNLCYAS